MNKRSEEIEKPLSASEFLQKISPTIHGIRADLERFRLRRLVEGIMDKYLEHHLQSLPSSNSGQVTELKEAIFQSGEYVKNIKEIEERGVRKLSYQNGFVDGAKWLRTTLQQPSDWISVEERLPESAQHCLVVVNELQPHTDEFNNEQFEDEVKIIYYFKETNVTGWQNDWTGEPSNVTHWMPLPNPPTNK